MGGGEIGNEGVISDFNDSANDKMFSLALRISKNQSNGEYTMSNAERAVLGKFNIRYKKYKAGKIDKKEMKEFVKEHRDRLVNIVKCLKYLVENRDFKTRLKEAFKQSAYGAGTGLYYGGIVGGLVGMGVSAAIGMRIIDKKGHEWIKAINEFL